MEIEDAAIIGAGPSGIAAAIQLKRYDIEPIIFEKNEIGGLLRNAHFVENYPGFPKGISGLSLVRRLKKHLDALEIPVQFERVLNLECHDEFFLLKTNKKELKARGVIVASGTKPRTFPGELLLGGAEECLLYEVYPVLGAKNKKVVIIGGGDAAFDYALNLARKNEVMILNKSQKAKCLPLLMDRCLRSDRISYFQRISICKIGKENSSMLTEFRTDGSHEVKSIYSDYVIAAIGRKPCLDFFSDEMKKNWDVPLKKKSMFMTGDVNNGIFRQAGISAGEGIKAAMMLYKEHFKGEI
ncbi:MAG: NAD(P)/FAD-dependent oxidoreductase [Candidatus Aminicenantaceae bacterium]